MTSTANTTNSAVHFYSIKSTRQHKKHRQSITGSSCTKAKLKSQVLVLYQLPN